jgi:ech hydrogenase subunit A
MDWVTFLILFPLIPAIILVFTKSHFLQKWIVLISSALVCIGSIGLAVDYMQAGGTYIVISSGFLNFLVVIGDVILALAFLYICRNLPIKKYWIPLMVIIQYGLVIFFDISGRIPETTRYLYIDNLSVVMVLVIGIVGSLIAVYTVGYMKHYHEHHKNVADRRNGFMAAIFLFFFAMFGVVLSNSLTWIYFFWEITTLCSFIMIGYSQTEEAVNNSFRALWMLLLGGLAFAVGILYAANNCGTIELQKLVTMKQSVVMLPILLLCFAGMNKAAQYPFGNWLLGAMVAPTPSSALLHSSTMVKAGVYLVLRCSPILQNSASGAIVAIIGGASFLMCSALAISQSNGKKVLAYSTIANLGLIVLCAGIGTSFTLWAALLLIIFHAVAKALMFLCVGTVDHEIGSQDIEDMNGLISRMPLVTMAMLIGLAGMFLAPFGMLISKWAVIVALANRNPIFPPIVIFGGSLMLFFWTKWMGNIISVSGKNPPVKSKGLGIEWIALGGLSVLTIAACIGFPLIGHYWIQPLYGWNPMLSERTEVSVLIMMFLMLAPIIIFSISWKRLVHTEPYLSGLNVEDKYEFLGSLGAPRKWSFRNYYINKYFSEEKLLKGTIIGTTILWILMFFMENL